MSIDMKGKVALITGAARGLGLHIARDLAGKGVNVCGSDLRDDLLEAEFEKIQQEFGVDTLALKTDVANEQEVCATVKQVYEKWGQLDILVNSAGMRMVGLLHETTLET